MLIAFDTNALVRMLVEDDEAQAKIIADFVIVNKATRLQATKTISFDKKLQKKFPGYVVEAIKLGED